GRLSVVAVVAGTVFSAISGSTIATTALLGSLLLPEMLRRGYHPNMAMGPSMATRGADMLIPPSALTVLLGSLSGISISQLLVAGIVPGVLLSAAFVAYIVAKALLNPRAPAPPRAAHGGGGGAAGRLRDAARADLRRGDPGDVGGLGHADRVGRDRRDRHGARGVALPVAHAGR